MKRKYGDRSGWKRIIERKYAQSYLDTTEFKGYITLLKTEKVAEPANVKYKETEVCIVNDGYMWLHHFPSDKKHCVTTMFDGRGEVVQWYIDICYKNSLHNDMPFMEDLYLDIIVLPTGEIIEKDAAELKEALELGVIDKHLYELAWTEQRSLLKQIGSGSFELMELAEQHKELLVNKLK